MNTLFRVPRWAAALCVALTSLSPAAAADNMFANKTAGEFVAYCDAHRDSIQALTGDCPEWIAWQDVFLSQEQPRTSCVVEHTDADQSHAYMAVLDWLKSHTETAGDRSDKAIAAAFPALYPCK